MVAVSQAPSPESNPNSPLPVKAMAGQYPAIKADRAEARFVHRRKKHAIRKVIVSHQNLPEGSWFQSNKRYHYVVFMHVLALELLRLSK